MSSKKNNRNKKRPAGNNRRSPADKKRLPSTTSGPRRALSPPRAVTPAVAPVADPVSDPAAEPEEQVGQLEEIDQTDPMRTDVTFSEPDLAAWAWLNTWPFVDDAAIQVEPEAEPVVPDEVAQEAPADEVEPLDDEDEDDYEDDYEDDDDDEDAGVPVPVRAAAVVPAEATPWWTGSTPPAAAVASAGGGRTRWLGIAVALLAATALVGLVWSNLLRSDDPAGPTASAAYAPPVHLAGDRAVVRSQVLPSGDLRVTHWIHASAMVHSVALRLPTVAGVTPGSITVSHLVVASDGVAVPTDSEPSAGRTQTLTLPPSHSIYLTYVLSGAVQHTSGPAGRALARLTSLEVTTDSTMPLTTHRVAGARVLALACSSPDVAALPHPCGSVQHGTWHVALGRSEARERVMAQLDLS